MHRCVHKSLEFFSKNRIFLNNCKKLKCHFDMFFFSTRQRKRFPNCISRFPRFQVIINCARLLCVAASSVDCVLKCGIKSGGVCECGRNWCSMCSHIVAMVELKISIINDWNIYTATANEVVYHSGYGVQHWGWLYHHFAPEHDYYDDYYFDNILQALIKMDISRVCAYEKRTQRLNGIAAMGSAFVWCARPALKKPFDNYAAFFGLLLNVKRNYGAKKTPSSVWSAAKKSEQNRKSTDASGHKWYQR